MSKLGLSPAIKCRFTLTTKNPHDKSISTNELNRQFSHIQINQDWTTDATYIATNESWLYLTVVMDLFYRTIVDRSMDKNMTEDLVMNALNMTLFRRKIPTTNGIVNHAAVIK